MKKEFEYPQANDDPAVAEFKERLIDRELDNGIFDAFLKPKGSFGALAAAEKRLKKEQED